MNNPVLRMYVDENGHYNLREDLTKDGNRFLCLTGVAMRISTHKQLTEQMDALKLNYFGDTNIVLHRRELIVGKPPFEALKDDSTREGFNRDLLTIMDTLPYRVISILVDKKALVEKYGLLRAQDPYAIALEFLMHRYQYWMQDFSTQNERVTGDILAEARGGREDKTTKETYRLIYNGQGYNRLANANMFYSSKEIKLKKKIDNIAGLQFVDLISHPARRYILSKYGLANNLKQTSFEQKVVDILVSKKFRRKNGKIEGAGTVFFPQT